MNEVIREAPEVPSLVGGLNAELKMPPNDPQVFNADYFLHGKRTGISNYEDYRYLESLSVEYVQNLTRHLGLVSTDTIHDVGCSRGYIVKVLRMFGHEATGHDISEWAIENCHPDVKPFVSTRCGFVPRSVDWIHGKDIFEHCIDKQVRELMPKVLNMARKGCLFIVPLTAYWGGKYIYPADNEDKTHRLRLTMDAWLKLLLDCAKETRGDFSIHGSYHMTGLKKASVEFPFSTGFLTCRRFL